VASYNKTKAKTKCTRVWRKENGGEGVGKRGVEEILQYPRSRSAMEREY